jgi:hypothetical protein
VARIARKLVRTIRERTVQVNELETAIRAWVANWNEDPRPFVWDTTADEILESLAAYCERISDSGH